MAPLPEPSPSELDDIRRKADDFAREAFTDALQRFEPLLRKAIPNSASENVPATDEETT
jgi:hypothetical protein